MRRLLLCLPVLLGLVAPPAAAHVPVRSPAAALTPVFGPIELLTPTPLPTTTPAPTMAAANLPMGWHVVPIDARVTVYNEPGYGGVALGVLTPGTVLTIAAESYGWYEVTFHDPHLQVPIAWVNAAYVRPLHPVPPTATPTVIPTPTGQAEVTRDGLVRCPDAFKVKAPEGYSLNGLSSCTPLTFTVANYIAVTEYSSYEGASNIFEGIGSDPSADVNEHFPSILLRSQHRWTFGALTWSEVDGYHDANDREAFAEARAWDHWYRFSLNVHDAAVPAGIHQWAAALASLRTLRPDGIAAIAPDKRPFPLHLSVTIEHGPPYWHGILIIESLPGATCTGTITAQARVDCSARDVTKRATIRFTVK